MRIVLTGGSGIIGSFVAEACRAVGHKVTRLGQDIPWRLGQPAPLDGQDALIHCAFAHAPGRYRGGEGDDPTGFRRANLEGSIRLFDEALAAGIGRVVFLSSRAVHDGHAPGTVLADDMPPAPANLYGEVKALAEAHLAGLPLPSSSLRATGVYGPGVANKWRNLFAAHLSGQPAPPRVATELHVADLARAILLLLTTPKMPAVLNASDLVLDHHDLLGMVNRITGCTTSPPAPSDPATLRLPDCSQLRSLGWHPGGMALLQRSLPLMLP